MVCSRPESGVEDLHFLAADMSRKKGIIGLFPVYQTLSNTVPYFALPPSVSFYLLTPLPYFNPSNAPFNLSHPSLPSQLSFALPNTLLTALLAFPFHFPPISGTSPP